MTLALPRGRNIRGVLNCETASLRPRSQKSVFSPKATCHEKGDECHASTGSASHHLKLLIPRNVREIKIIVEQLHPDLVAGLCQDDVLG